MSEYTAADQEHLVRVVAEKAYWRERCVLLEEALRGWYSIQLLGTVARALEKASPNEVRDLRILTREALVGTREKDLGGEQSSPCEGSGGES